MKNITFRNALPLKFTTVAAATAMTLLLPAVQGSAATVEKEATTEVSGESAGVTFTGRLGVGYLTGQAREYVYWADAGGHTASELIWDIDSVYMFGIGGSIRPLTWLNINADLWINMGDGDGYMEDYDWMVVGMDWTDQSVHDNTDVTKAIMFDINVEMTVLSTDTISLNGIAGYRRDAFEWEARGGSYIYSVSAFRDTSGTFSGDELGITYEQIFDVPYIGIGFVGDFDSFHVAAKVTGSFLVSGEATDHHHMRNLVTYDDFSGENMLAFDITLGYDITESIGVTASYSYEKYDTMKGDSEWHFNDEGVVYLLEDGAGADLETSMFSMNMTYQF
jgi:plasminogen activator